MNQITADNRLLFEGLVEEIKKRHEAAGIAVAIVDAEGKTQYEKYFGYRDQEKKLPMDANTIFGVASVTKSFTALAIMQLAEEGKIDLEAPVSRYVPEFTNKNQEPVKVWHFLCHSGGFYPVHRTVIREIIENLGRPEELEADPAYDEKLAKAGARAVAEQLDAQTKEHGLIGRPGEYMSYCNDGFALLSEIIRREGGEASFAEYVEKHILKPLGMDRSGCDYIRPSLDENCAVLYKHHNGAMTGGWDYFDHAFVLGGGGAMKSTLSDMKRYVTMYLNCGKTADGGRVLSREGVRAMCCPRIEYRPDSFYCYGLSTKRLEDLTVVEHGGSLTGVSSNMSWSYDAGAGVIVLCNTSDVPVSVIADAAMKMYHGRNPLPDRSMYRECRWSEEKWQAVCGKYISEEENQLEIFRKDGAAKVRINGTEAEFLPVQEYLGIVRRAEKDDTIRLFEDGEGRIFAAGFGGRMLPRVESPSEE